MSLRLYLDEDTLERALMGVLRASRPMGVQVRAMVNRLEFLLNYA